MDLQQALDIHPGELVAFVGAGSKTPVAWRLLHLLVTAGERVIFTTTTYIFEPKGTPLLLSPDPEPEDVVRALMESTMLVLAAAREEVKGLITQSPGLVHPVKLVGMAPQVLSDLARRLPGVTWLVEADEVKGHKLTAPTEHGSVLPSATDRVVVVAEIETLGQSLDKRTAHRPELAVRLLGILSGTKITPEVFIKLISHRAEDLKSLLANVAIITLLTQQDERPHPQAAAVARLLLKSPYIGRVALVSLSAANPVLEVWR